MKAADTTPELVQSLASEGDKLKEKISRLKIEIDRKEKQIEISKEKLEDKEKEFMLQSERNQDERRHMAKELEKEACRHEETILKLKNNDAQVQVMVTLCKRMFKEVAERVKSLRNSTEMSSSDEPAMYREAMDVLSLDEKELHSILNANKISSQVKTIDKREDIDSLLS